MAQCLKFLPAATSWIVLSVSTGSFFYFVCPYLNERIKLFVAIFQGLLTFFLYMNLILATFMDPGILNPADMDEYKDEDPPYLKVVKIEDISVKMKWCTTCQFYRPPRSSHCSTCGNCIETFDHHCPWINNCIGKHNYRHFFLFLVFLCIHMITVFTWCILYLIDHKDLKQVNSMIALSLAILVFILVWLPLGLTVFHIVLIMTNRTTNEQMTGKFKIGQNPFHKGHMRNCLEILCGPHMPKSRLFRVDSSTEQKVLHWI